MVSEGDLLAGKYRVERVLGEGGMGYVVSAIHEQLEQRVAVKLLVPALAEDADAVARFLREARAAVRIQSEHVARVLDVGELANGEPYLVMEFLNGQDLAQELDTRETFPVATAIDYVLQACEAVAEAHALGVIHRDLKPANLFLTRRPDGTPLVKVLDFGISKAIASSSGPVNASPSLTAAQSLLGSPAYMSPEQARRPKSVDIRTDIWSLGVILYEFLGGETPFLGDAPLEVLTAAVSDPMPSLRELRPDVPRELEAVVAKCLEKKPDDRYQTVGEFAEALRPFAAAESLQSIGRVAGILRSALPIADPASTTMRSASAPPTRGTADTEAVPAGSGERSTRPDKDTQMDWGKSQSGLRRSRRAMLLIGVAAGAALVTVVAMKTLGDRSSPARPSDVTPARQPAVPSPVTRATVAQPTEPVAPSATATTPPAAAVASAPSAAAPAASTRTPAPSAPATPRAPKSRTRTVTTGPLQTGASADDEDPLANRR